MRVFRASWAILFAFFRFSFARGISRLNCQSVKFKGSCSTSLGRFLSCTHIHSSRFSRYVHHSLKRMRDIVSSTSFLKLRNEWRIFLSEIETQNSLPFCLRRENEDYNRFQQEPVRNIYPTKRKFKNLSTGVFQIEADLVLTDSTRLCNNFIPRCARC